jgi:transposase
MCYLIARKEKIMALSVDLRERVIAAIDSNIRIIEIAKIFKVSRKVIYNWLDLRNKSGSLAPKSGYQKGHSHKIKDLEAFKLFVEKNKHNTINQMVVSWKKITGVSMSDVVMGRYLKKIGYSSKKNIWIHRSKC